VDVFQKSDKYLPCTISFCFECSLKSHDEDRKLVSNNWDVSGWGPTKLMTEFYLAQHAQWYFPFPCNDDSSGLGFRYNMSYNYYYYYYLVSIPELSTQKTKPSRPSRWAVDIQPRTGIYHLLTSYLMHQRIANLGSTADAVANESDPVKNATR